MDAYLPILGSKHPAGVGQPGAQLWAEIWDVLEPMVAEVFAGRPQWVEDMPFALAGGATDEVRWFSFSFTPLRDEQDRSREHSPLVPAPGAVELDTTGLSIEQVVERIARLVNEAR